jgi:serine/threonine protein kinase
MFQCFYRPLVLIYLNLLVVLGFDCYFLLFLCIDLEYVATGVLLPLDVVVNTFLQIISALNHIHSKGIVHFDVKLEVSLILFVNILLFLTVTHS